MKNSKTKERNLRARTQKVKEQKEYSTWKKSIKDHEKD